MTPNLWFTTVATIVFGLMMVFPIALRRRCGPDAHRLLKNDPGFGFFAPLVFPLAMGVLAKSVATVPLTVQQNLWLGAVFVVFALLAASLIHADMKLGPLEPYMLRTDEALLHEVETRARLRDLYREIHTGDLTVDQKNAAVTEIGGLQRDAILTHRRLAPGFTSWRDLRARGAGVAWSQVFINSVVAVGCAALFSWLVIAVYRALHPPMPLDLQGYAAAADANMICVGLLMLWFPMRLYSEWYLGFYTFRGLREYRTFWFLSVVALVGVLLIAIILQPRALPIGLAAFGTSMLVIFGLFARLKPQLLGYAAVLFEEMPLFPYLFTLVLGVFAVLLTIVLAVTS